MTPADITPDRKIPHLILVVNNAFLTIMRNSHRVSLIHFFIFLDIQAFYHIKLNRNFWLQAHDLLRLLVFLLFFCHFLIYKLRLEIFSTSSSLFTFKTMFARSSVYENKVLSQNLKLCQADISWSTIFHKLNNTVVKMIGLYLEYFPFPKALTKSEGPKFVWDAHQKWSLLSCQL